MKTAAITLLLGLLGTIAADDKKPRLDVHGDTLPEGAIARLGSARLRHGEAVSFTAFLPDGKTLVSTGADWNIRLWDVANGKELKHFSHIEDADNRRIALRRPGRNSPLLACMSSDGKVMATCAVNGRSVQVWDLSAGKTVKTITPGTQSVNAIAISPDGKTLAVSMSDASIRIIETATGKELRSVGRENQPMGGFSFSGGFSGLRFSPDNKTLVLMGMEFDNGMLKRSLRAWDATTGKMLYRTEADAQRTLFGSTPSFSPDGKQFVLSTYQGDLHLVEATTGKEGRVIKSGMGRIDSVIFSHDGKQVIARGMNDSGLGIWDASNGKEVKVVGKAVQPGGVIRPRFSSYSGITGGMSLSPDGKRIATPDGNQVRLIDLSNGKDVFTSSGHRGAINSLRFLGDGKSLLSQSLDGSLRLWDPMTGKQTGEVKVPDNAYTFHLSNDAKFMAVEGTDGATRVINVETSKELCKLPQAQPMRLAMFAFSPDNRRLAMRSRTESVTRIFSVATGIELATLGKPNPMDQPFRTSMRSSAMAFSPDGTLLAAPGDETGLILWDVADKSMRREIAIPANVQLRDVVFSRDGRLLAIDLGDNRAIVHEIASGLERHRFTRKGEEIKKEPVQEVRQVFFATSAMQASQTLAFSRDGRRLAMATEGRVVHVWDALTGDDLGKRSGHQGEIGAVAFSPDGELLATGGEDAIGLIWDMAALKSIKNPVVELNQGDLETRWNALYAADGAGAFTAIAGLTNAPNATVPFLDKLLKIPEDVNADVIDRLIVDLDARRFPTRKKAQEDLEKIGAKAVPALKKALDRQASEEIKKRAQELLDKLQGATRTPPQLQASRAIEVLERIGTTEAKAVLERLSKGPAWSLEAIESRAALERLR